MSDLISRQTAIEEIEFGITYAKVIDIETGQTRELFQQGNDELRKAVERIKRLPSAEPRWIRMTDRTPEVGQDVLVTTDGGNMLLVTYANMEWIQGHCFHWKPNFRGTEYLGENDVIAWMPLPESYQEAEHAQLD